MDDKYLYIFLIAIFILFLITWHEIENIKSKESYSNLNMSDEALNNLSSLATCYAGGTCSMTNLNITGNLKVGNNISMNNTSAQINTPTTIGSNLTISGSSTMNGNTTMNGSSTQINSPTTINNNLTVGGNTMINGETKVARGTDGKYWRLAPHDNGAYSKYFMIKREDVINNCCILIHQDDTSDCITKSGGPCRHYDINIGKTTC